ncbi:hypothetical protein [Actinokineospora iranica]|uniref:50S ribosome-binding GTPase n=1 Tax=Actinokineospora iranica TaxID=1271860 RepID=A0A1G6WBT3_9PSEU|nr:hypothetical protein [Actinokineospora iranica]SDD63301.1 hypothetical protein SAMN05216174_114111 [Actinokineospora iranica]
MSLSESAWTLLDRALAVYRDSPRADAFLRAHLARMDGPLRLAITGPPKSGRSTLLDATVGAAVSAQSDRLTVDWPGEVELIDAEPDIVPADADALLHLLPHPGGADLRALRAAQENPVARAAPVSAVVVLSRADELGASRVDALVSARQVARRHARSAELRGLCQDVVPVAGLVAFTGATLTPAEAGALATLGAVPRPDLESSLLSADRFAAPTFPAPIDAPTRTALLTRLGLFGVRLGITLARRGFRTQEALSTELVRGSGIADLRDAIGACFVDRAETLKARSALIALDVVLRREPRPPAAPLAADLERVLSSTHDLRELRLLAALRTGRVNLGDPTEEARYLLGGHGTTPKARLSMTPDPYEAVLRWQALAEDPRLDDRERQAAAVVARSCEELMLTTGKR